MVSTITVESTSYLLLVEGKGLLPWLALPIFASAPLDWRLLLSTFDAINITEIIFFGSGLKEG